MARSVSDQQILEAALNTIVEHGYTGASTRQIAEAAGVNEVTLFRRFGNKQNILLSAVQCQVEGFAAEAIRYTGDVEADLTRIVTAHGKFSEKKGKLFPMLMAELPRQPELTEVLNTPFAVIGQVVSVIKRYQDDGILVKEDPVYTIATLLGPTVLIEMMSECYGPKLITSPISVEHRVKTFLRGHQRVDDPQIN